MKKYIKAINNASGLSLKTKENYIQRLRLWVEGTKKTILTILKKPDVYIQWLKDTKSEPQTQKSYLVGILAIFKHTPGLKEKFPEESKKWFEAFSTLDRAIDDRYKTNEPTDKQKEGYVPFKEIEKKRDTLKEGTKERLLLAMYTYIPPLRNDYNAVYIYNSTPSGEIGHPNYIALDKGLMVIREHKTVNKVGVYENVLPKPLLHEIIKSLETSPRDWLFSDKDNEPYSSGTFNKWVNRVLLRLFGKPLTISLIRHVYINDIDFNSLRITEKEKIAKLMCHKIGTQDKYRLFFDTKNN